MPRATDSAPGAPRRSEYRPYQARSRGPSRAPTEPRSSFRDRNTDLVGKFRNEGLRLHDYTTYTVDSRPPTGSLAVYANPATIDFDGWNEIPFAPTLNAFTEFGDALVARAARQETTFDKENLKDLIDGNIFCYGVERLGTNHFLGYWAQIRNVAWRSPTGVECFHADLILRRYVTRYTSAIEVPLGQIRNPYHRSARFSDYLDLFSDNNGELEEELHNLPDPTAAGTAEQPVLVEDEAITTD